MGFYGNMAIQLKKYPNLIDVPVEKLTLRIGLCFRLLKKVIQAQQAVALFEKQDLEDYLMKIVKATFHQ